ncbi:methyltetrahydrofolate--corrinoid methyltransferase [Acetobacterium paludosum]|uniref:Methyltetrahydrofolate--corrinoid methyltransferase n=1 Tax=Acetobacterium paludosum TaxID=52693 RepID=A0A923HQK8_9FIRM|nr:dihydropteroate synthase [Acetobacterium paludosum]MBC3886913.1 methyltetrahydrofolate--corrinoid methyltransferase [Acetobacterium paludosum]
MIFIGEKINGTRKAIQEAIINRDVDFIKKTALEQDQAGANYLDINAGTDPSREKEDMLWLLEVVQSVTDMPICIDSSTPEVIKEAIRAVKATPMINSINGDPERLKSFIPFIKERDCNVIALAMDESQSGMPKTVDERMTVLKRIFQATRNAGIADSKVFIDPLIMAVATDQTAGLIAFESIRSIRKNYPEAHITGGLSNISFGLPNRALVNRTFLTLAVEAGMDSAVVNPENVPLIESLKATEMLLGRDRFCRKYTVAAKIDFTKK